MIGCDVTSDAEKPGRERCDITPVSMARPPGFLERPRRQVLRVGRRAEAIPEEVVDARQLIRVDRVPIGFRGRQPAYQPARHRLLNRHLEKYTVAHPAYHTEKG